PTRRGVPSRGAPHGGAAPCCGGGAVTTLHAQVIAAAPFSVNIVDDVRSMLGLDFMRNAFIAGGAIAVAAGFVGYFVVLRNQVFSSDAIAHTAFTGGLAGLLAGAGLGAGMFGACIAVALGIEAAGGRGRGRDVAIGIVFAAVLGTGVLLLSVFTETSSAASATAGVSVLF